MTDLSHSLQDVEIVFYDGQCALCHGFVEFLFKSQAQLPQQLRFAPLQGETFKKLCQESPALERYSGVDSVVFFRVSDGRAWIKSAAVAQIFLHLGGLHSLTGRALRFVPRFVRDAGYDQVASVRYKIFGKKEDFCPMPEEENAFRFLP